MRVWHCLFLINLLDRFWKEHLRTIMYRSVVVWLGFMLPALTEQKCPCTSEALCKPVTKQYTKELVVFGGVTWKQWNWTEITNVITLAPSDYDLYCYAHSRSVRVTRLVSVPVNDFLKLADPMYRKNVTKRWINMMVEHFFDGINIDIEGAAYTEDIRNYITALTNETYIAIKALNPYFIVTWDIPYSPILVGCISGYCYDYISLAKCTDYMIVMDYDATLDILVANANSPINLLIESYNLYLKNLSINPNHLVMAVPWYGYDYACTKFYNDSGQEMCVILGGSHQAKSYGDIDKLIVQSGGIVRWDSKAASPYLTLMENTQYHQVWFDNVESLKIKYKLALSLHLRGIGMFTGDDLDYHSLTPSAVNQTTLMWDTLTEYVDQLKTAA